MKTIQDYQNLKNRLQTIKDNHEEKYLDPNFIKISGSGLGWREYKKLGMIKSYEGWVFYSTSTNSNGYDLYEKLKKECEGFNLYVSERQL